MGMVGDEGDEDGDDKVVVGVTGMRTSNLTISYLFALVIC